MFEGYAVTLKTGYLALLSISCLKEGVSPILDKAAPEQAIVQGWPFLSPPAAFIIQNTKCHLFRGNHP